MPTDLLAVVLALAVLVAVGGLVAGATLRRGVGTASFLALSYALGVGCVTHEMFLLSIAGVRWPGWAWLALPWLLLLAAVVRRRRGPREEVPLAPARGFFAGPPEARIGIGVVLVAIVAVNVVTVYVLAIERPTWSFDALTRWMFKPKIFFADRSVLPYFADLERGDTQPHFPQLVSLAVTWEYLVLGRVDDRLGKLFFVASYVFLLVGVHGVARRFTSRIVALAATAVLSALPCLAYRNAPPGNGPPGVGAHTAMADVTLALYEVLALGMFLLWIRDGGRGRLILAFALGGFAALSKQEGALVLVLLTAFTAATLAWRRPGWRSSAASIGAVAAVVAFLYLPWYLTQRRLPVTDTIYLPMHFTPATVFANVSRIPVIAGRFWQEFTSFDLWNVFWVLVAASVVAAPRAILRTPNGVLLLAILGLVSAYATVYLLDETMGAEGYRTKMELSLTRLLIHVAPIAALLFACQAEAVLRRLLPLREDPPRQRPEPM